ncbi:MAG TPA: alpha-ketoglutarate-dependent dioxygenase AlkB [Candidatus Saccharimonadales bacterium]|nr:alpha-ketoglutarate-dependent dioxygenase AlkB [Candidatus Saccharimonadales bacterium]
MDIDNATITYTPNYLSIEEADDLFTSLSNLFTEEQKHIITDDDNNKLYTLNRKTLVFIDNTINDHIIPKIWGKDVTILPFSSSLQELKLRLEQDLNFNFNICLANYYNTGKNTIGWHSDNEEKGSTSCIASISLGAERLFAFRKCNSKDIIKQMSLEHGSLLMMGKGCQEEYQHSLLADKTVRDPRLNLTFRLFDNQRYENY